jgi:hypothetical protein
MANDLSPYGVDMHFINELKQCLSFGADKYGIRDWQKNTTIQGNALAAIGHIIEAYKYKTVDLDTRLSPLTHAICRILFMQYLLKKGDR